MADLSAEHALPRVTDFHHAATAADRLAESRAPRGAASASPCGVRDATNEASSDVRGVAAPVPDLPGDASDAFSPAVGREVSLRSEAVLGDQPREDLTQQRPPVTRHTLGRAGRRESKWKRPAPRDKPSSSTGDALNTSWSALDMIPKPENSPRDDGSSSSSALQARSPSAGEPRGQGEPAAAVKGSKGSLVGGVDDQADEKFDRSSAIEANSSEDLGLRTSIVNSPLEPIANVLPGRPGVESNRGRSTPAMTSLATIRLLALPNPNMPLLRCSAGNGPRQTIQSDIELRMHRRRSFCCLCASSVRIVRRSCRHSHTLPLPWTESQLRKKDAFLREGCCKLVGVVFFITVFLSAMTIHEGIGSQFSMKQVVLGEVTDQPFGPHSLTFNDVSNSREVWEYLDGGIRPTSSDPETNPVGA